MAIQVNGTTVINNSRALQNIASIDSTTASAIGAQVGGGWDLPSSPTYTVGNTSQSITAGLYLVIQIVGYSGAFTRTFTGGSNKVLVGLTDNNLNNKLFASGSTIGSNGSTNGDQWYSDAYSKFFGWFMTDSTATFTQSNSGYTYNIFFYRLQS